MRTYANLPLLITLALAFAANTSSANPLPYGFSQEVRVESRASSSIDKTGRTSDQFDLAKWYNYLEKPDIANTSREVRVLLNQFPAPPGQGRILRTDIRPKKMYPPADPPANGLPPVPHPPSEVAGEKTWKESFSQGAAPAKVSSPSRHSDSPTIPLMYPLPQKGSSSQGGEERAKVSSSSQRLDSPTIPPMHPHPLKGTSSQGGEERAKVSSSSQRLDSPTIPPTGQGLFLIAIS
ncbi:hypothetical protein J3R30DRAFT_3555026 [Lentinula aciculospora]|uniref:Uncharacterized protein n=1 Tax=Lentinula aciculospora TaxID=153920 RepID=A0A9W8ZYS2_9AGAR|nr:hypothetical protein J3R30DRAFT_3555026 [Lentinula aciculospora]